MARIEIARGGTRRIHVPNKVIRPLLHGARVVIDESCAGRLRLSRRDGYKTKHLSSFQSRICQPGTEVFCVFVRLL